MSEYIVTVTDDRYKSYKEEEQVLSNIGAKLVVNNCLTSNELIECCKNSDAILCNLAPMTAEVIESLSKCRVISRYGVGYDNIDVEACSKKGIIVTNVLNYCNEEVSDQALALLMSCVRKTARRDEQIRKGMWNVGQADKIYRMAGRNFSFLGFGAIAKCLYRKIGGMDFGRILVYDPFFRQEDVDDYNVEIVDFKTALSEADYISIHMPLNNQTKGIIDKRAFALMKQTAIIVNTSRGGLIHEAALIEALTKGIINSAGLDVHAKEPMNQDNHLLNIDNCVLTDHVGWYSEESMSELKIKAAENIRDVLLGKKPKYPVN